MPKLVYLFPDTNVLVQCLPLEQLDWSACRDFDEVHLIISRPVQSEIDNQKNKGGERLARRARKASSLLRDILVGGHEHLLVRPADPAVKLFIRTALRPSPELAEVLDYDRTDDQLVGTAHAFVQQNPGADVRVLTHDTGPMASAQMVGISIAPVSDNWLLPPEPSEADKRIRSLEAEVARLTDAEPKFSIACIDTDGNERSTLEFEFVHYEPLTQAELSVLVEKLEQRFPLATDFGPRELTELATLAPIRLPGVKEVFTPATEKEIEDYREKHEQWLKQCGDRLRDLYRTLQARHGPPVFVFSASNYGARPANDALVTFRALGQLEIMPPPYRSRDHDDEESDKRVEEAPALSNPPSVPRGSWATVLAPRLGTFDALQKFHRGFGLATASTVMSENLLRGLSRPEPRDPNGFYYKPNRPRFPSEQFSLECQQWRHGIEPHQFVGQIHFDEVAESISGAIECRIHAENLSQSAAKTVPVRIRVRRVSALEIAEDMVRRLSP